MTVSYLLTFKKFYQNKNQHTSFLKKNSQSKKGVEVSIGAFCKQGGSPHNTKGLNTKIYQKLVNFKNINLMLSKRLSHKTSYAN